MRTKIIFGLIVIAVVAVAVLILSAYRNNRLGTSADVTSVDNTITIEDEASLGTGTFDGTQYLDGRIQLAPETSPN